MDSGSGYLIFVFYQYALWALAVLAVLAVLYVVIRFAITHGMKSYTRWERSGKP